jgi:methylated-DNA-protein-cysteine methyltransferase related protein
MSDQPNFPQKVLALVNAIPAGKVMTYGQIAKLLDNPRASRAVGYAMNALPFGTPVPWHRVVGKNGSYGKISLRPFGHDEQIARLTDEGIVFDENEQFLLADYLWQPSPEEVAGNM